MDLAEPFTEALEPCGERRLVSRWLFAITSFACVVGHAFDTCDCRGEITAVPRPQGRAEHTDWVEASQESARLQQVAEDESESCPQRMARASL